jgi:tRNA uracil 4-sulfurtransferase
MNLKFDSIIIRYNEISLKGKNRFIFEKRLISNIKKAISNNPENNKEISILRPRGRVLIESNLNDYNVLKRVFGIYNFSPAIKTNIDLDSIKNTISPFLKDFKNTFRVSVTRIEKISSLNSMEMEKELGSFIVEKTNAKVKLKNYETNFSIEIMNNSAYFFINTHKAFSGLPIGTQENINIKIENEKDILSALFMMRRGCSITPLIIGNIDYSILDNYSYGINLKPILFKNKEDCDKFIKDKKIEIITTGENKIENIKKEEIITLYPLIGFTDEEINQKLEIFRKEI